jgi:hypothetical protein
MMRPEDFFGAARRAREAPLALFPPDVSTGLLARAGSIPLVDGPGFLPGLALLLMRDLLCAAVASQGVLPFEVRELRTRRTRMYFRYLERVRRQMLAELSRGAELSARSGQWRWYARQRMRRILLWYYLLRLAASGVRYWAGLRADIQRTAGALLDLVDA